MTTEGKLVVWAVIILILGGGWGYFSHRATQEIAENQKIVATSTTPQPFVIDGVPVTLINGVSEIEAAPGSASKITTRYFGNEAKADLNNDGIEDSVFLVTQTTGGSGTFYYVATSLGGPALVLGDRIAPQTTEYRNGKIIVNYADRNAGEPMTAQPTFGVSRYFVWANGELSEVKSENATSTSLREN